MRRALGYYLAALLISLALWIGIIAVARVALGQTAADVGTGFTSSNPTGEIAGDKYSGRDRNALGTPDANFVRLHDNDVDLATNPTCALQGTAGKWSLIDNNEAATDNWIMCDGTSDFFDVPNTGSDEIADAQILVGTGAGSGAYVAMSGDVAIANTGATTIQPNAVELGNDTTQNFVTSVSTTAPITCTGCTASEGSTPALALNQNAGTDITADLEEETHATEHSLGGTDPITVTNLASACTNGQVLGGTVAGTGVECQADVDTNANTLCSGTTTYLDGEGNCDDIASVYAAASHAHAGEDVTSGTVADARIASTLTRDSEWDTTTEINAATTDADFLVGPLTGDVTTSASVATIGANKITSGMVAFNYAGSASEGGAATTALALDANPADCAANQFATTIAASGALTCAALTDADVPDDITIDHAATATALATNPAACTAGQYVTDADANGTLTCAQVAFSQLSGSLAFSSLTGSIAPSQMGTQDFGDFSCATGTCTLDTGPAFTTSTTYTIDSDNGGTEPANGAGVVIEGGSGTNVTLTYDSTGNDFEFRGASGGYYFDGPVVWSAADGSRTITYEDNTVEPSAPASGFTATYALGGELYKKDNGDGSNERLILTSANVVGDITCAPPSSGTSTCDVAAGVITATELAANSVGTSELIESDSYTGLTGNWQWNDNADLRFGTGTDAEIYYDGTDLRVNPKLVGTGRVRVDGFLEVGNGGGTYTAVTRGIEWTDALTMDNTADVGPFGAFSFAPTITWEANPLIVAGTLFSVAPTHNNPSGEARTLGIVTSYSDTSTFALNATTGAVTGTYLGFTSSPTFNRAAGSNSATYTATQFQAGGVNVGSGATVSERVALDIIDAAPTGTLTIQYGIDIDFLDGANSGAVASNIGIRNASTTVLTPSSTQTITAGGTISPNATTVAVQSTGSVTTSTTTAISDGVNGQILWVVNVDSGDVVTVDNGGNTRLPGGTDCALGQYDALGLIYSSTIGDWVGFFCAANA